MAENESGSEKTEQPTSKRIQKSRQDGNVAKSMEVNSVAILIASIIMLMLWGPTMKDSLAYIMQSIIRESPYINITFESVRYYFLEGVIDVLLVVLPFMLAIALTGIFSNIFQFGLLWSMKPLEPKFGKLFNPTTIFKKFFGAQTYVQLVRDLFKTAVAGYIGYITIKEELENMIPLIDMSVQEIFSYAASAVMLMLIRITAALIILAVADKIYTSWKHNEDLKMTKQEVKEEMKQSEMPSEVKKKISERQVDVFLKGMMKNAHKADVVITNPIHVAVGLKYDQNNMSSPKVIAKGLRLIADRIKEIANENNIPIVENPPLARSLYKKVEVGDEIPEDFFKAVAEVLAFVYKMKEKKTA